MNNTTIAAHTESGYLGEFTVGTERLKEKMITGVM